VTLVVDVPLAPGRTTALDVRGPAVGLEHLGRAVGEHQLSRRQRPGDELGCDGVAIGHLEVIELGHDPTVGTLGAVDGRRPCREREACRIADGDAP
jgi:hypothetical protein